MLRSYRFLAFTSVLGDIAVTAGIISVVVYGATQHTFKVRPLGTTMALQPRSRREGVCPVRRASIRGEELS